jgi:hypothetical protein
MAYIVDMFWGRGSGIAIYGYNKDGVFGPIGVAYDGEPPDPDRRTFCCHGDVWYDTLAIGRRHGWRGRGAIPAAESSAAWHQRGGFDASYEPEGRRLAKQVHGEDAAALAEALQRALDDPTAETALKGKPISPVIREGMSAAEYVAANRPLSPEFLRDFVAFLRQGPFVFCWGV